MRGALRGSCTAASAVITSHAPRFIIFITIPCALVPGLLVAIFGKRQRNRALEELAQSS